jgi:hypothetical protein
MRQFPVEVNTRRAAVLLVDSPVPSQISSVCGYSGILENGSRKKKDVVANILRVADVILQKAAGDWFVRSIDIRRLWSRDCTVAPELRLHLIRSRSKMASAGKQILLLSKLITVHLLNWTTCTGWHIMVA